MCGKITLIAQRVAFAAVMLGTVSSAHALPWDQDMYSQESLQSNEVARAPVKGTVAIGQRPFKMSADDADQGLQNPQPATLHSVWHGQRLYNANCLTCHGKKGDAKSPIGASGALPVPNLLEDFYKKRGDGRFYAVIHNGGAAMPRYGYKFSPQEYWDIINYVRFLQGVKDVPGMKRPE